MNPAYLRKASLFFGLAVAAAGAAALAGETRALEGTVKDVNAEGRALTLQTTQESPTGGRVNVLVPPDSKLAGAGTLGEVRSGDKLRVEVAEDPATGSWKAKSIRDIQR